MKIYFKKLVIGFFFILLFMSCSKKIVTVVNEEIILPQKNESISLTKDILDKIIDGQISNEKLNTIILGAKIEYDITEIFEKSYRSTYYPEVKYKKICSDSFFYKNYFFTFLINKINDNNEIVIDFLIIPNLNDMTLFNGPIRIGENEYLEREIVIINEKDRSVFSIYHIDLFDLKILKENYSNVVLMDEE
jgi:hypothetical protein